MQGGDSHDDEDLLAPCTTSISSIMNLVIAVPEH